MKGAGWGWVVLASYVVAYDAWAIKTHHETLSSAFSRAINHPIQRWPTIATATILYTHLMIPQRYHKYDPLRYVAGRLTQ